jgi:hypothetical protein
MQTKPYIWVLIPILSIVLAACATAVVSQDNGDVSAGNQGVTEVGPTEEVLATEEGNPPTDTAQHSEAACDDPFDGTFPAFSTAGWETNFCIHSVPYDEIFSGGPPRDGIPPLDSPRFEDVMSADEWIDDVEPVILFEIDGIARAYPLQIMTWHEIVNDNIAGNPVVVTFCPLCNTALVFRRPTINNETLTFGTSGNLRNSDLVMWDRQTESWWQQFNGQAIVGDLTGTQLEFLPASIISWADFKARFPDSEVLSIETGFRRSYGRNPYTGYDNVDSFPFAFTGDLNDELPPMARVLGIQLENGSGIAITLDLIQEELVLNETIADTPVVIFWKPGTASALDSSSIAGGRDIGSTGVFLREVAGQVLTFQENGDGTFSDLESGSTWDILGKAISGPSNGTQLIALPHHDTFWFAWAAFVPDIEIKR